MYRFDTLVPHFITRVWGMHIIVTPDIVFEVLHVPKVAYPDYPSCDRLRTVSKDELSSLFHETPSSWSDRQNTLYSCFAKGLRFLNMVMTFVLHPLSHYNSIIEPRARFLLSLLGGLTIDFPSHFILSFIDVYRIWWLAISSFFLQLSRGFFAIFLSFILCLLISRLCVP